jgi:hypothetical protein
MLFAATAVTGALLVATRAATTAAGTVALAQWTTFGSGTLGARMAAVFTLITTAAAHRCYPRWLAIVGYAAVSFSCCHHPSRAGVSSSSRMGTRVQFVHPRAVIGEDPLANH